jgi:hypothetical protein
MSSEGQGDVYHGSGAGKSHKGGFFQWLKPGEKFTLPPEVSLPPELATVVPELFALTAKTRGGVATSSEITPAKETVTRVAKIKGRLFGEEFG